MQIRQILATAAVAAVTAPVALLSVSPAYADTKPAAQTQKQPSIAELRKAYKAAKQAYQEAVAAEKAIVKEIDDFNQPSNPLKVAADAAKTAAVEAAKAKDEADKAVDAAQQKLADAGDDEALKEAAQKELDLATATAAEKATAKTAADAKYAEANDAFHDANVALFKKLNDARNAIDDARAAKQAAKKALDDALAEQEGSEDPQDPDCPAGSDLKSALSGLPSKIAAGSTVDFRLRLTNTSKRTLDEVYPFVAVGAVDKSEKDLSDKLHLKSKQGGTWKSVDMGDYAGRFTNVKAGAHVDLPLRLTIDRSTPAGYGASIALGEYFNQDKSCGASDWAVYEFTINPVGAGNSDTPAKPGNKPKPQGSASPIASSDSGSGSGTANGSLASTGSSSALPTIGLAGGAAVVLGAGAVYVVRRRKAAANS
ncbi:MULTISPECIES: LPXTG cell wall anchor domain-containing protein [unclassified Streptomyces]|uniref:LPXTG cell wall anchor domain-containing protein n=1 Tax=unclassified Streptomyces TaxID=2593676 RepID=UPI00278C4C0E|nr:MULTISPECIES: LPXTG cell wall anchor domain-containing protein [unclassified Streptomyces]